MVTVRQQPGDLRKSHHNPRLANSDGLFWVIGRRLWAKWIRALILVQPEAERILRSLEK
jgi:hypothetical protein